MGVAKNIDVRIMITDSGLKHREVAEKMGIDPTSLSRLLRKDLSIKSRVKIINAIEELRRERSAE